MTLIRCYVCATFFPKGDRECPDCSTPVRGVNVGLLGSRWESALNSAKRHAIDET